MSLARCILILTIATQCSGLFALRAPDRGRDSPAQRLSLVTSNRSRLEPEDDLGDPDGTNTLGSLSIVWRQNSSASATLVMLPSGQSAATKLLDNATAARHYGNEDAGMPAPSSTRRSNSLLSLEAALGVPVLLIFIYYSQCGRPQNGLLLLLPIAYCTFQVMEDVVSQWLVAVVDAPNLIAAFKTLSMGILCLTWSLTYERDQLHQLTGPALRLWFLVSFSFAGFQLLNHLVYQDCSLAERTVFTNVSPAISLVVEQILMPSNRKPALDSQIVMSLATMVLGALLFSCQFPDFTPKGTIYCMLMVMALVPLRILQRWYVSEYLCMPIGLLSSIDALVLFLPSMSITMSVQDDFAAILKLWLSNPAVASMLILASVLFAVKHVLTLVLLRIASVTRYLVIHSIANFVVVALGFLYFGDRIMSAPLVLIGLLLSLFGGCWYAIVSMPHDETKPSSFKEADSVPEILPQYAWKSDKV